MSRFHRHIPVATKHWEDIFKCWSIRQSNRYDFWEIVRGHSGSWIAFHHICIAELTKCLNGPDAQPFRWWRRQEQLRVKETFSASDCCRKVLITSWFRSRERTSISFASSPHFAKCFIYVRNSSLFIQLYLFPAPYNQQFHFEGNGRESYLLDTQTSVA
jgi:hypothetical protein